MYGLQSVSALKETFLILFCKHKSRPIEEIPASYTVKDSFESEVCKTKWNYILFRSLCL